MSRPFSLLLKPAGADCNLRCDYCFYLEKAELYGGLQHPHRMTNTILEKTVAAYMATEQPVYNFAWQGGEPTLMGLEFFRRAVELQKQYGSKGAHISNALQTNGTRLTEEFVDFLREYNFLVGISVDGPQQIHDALRPYESGRGSHAAVMRGAALLRDHNVEHNVLTLVNAYNVDNPRALYRYLKDEGFEYQQYIPCVEHDSDGVARPWTVDAESWGRFLCELFDEWCADPEPASIRQFDAIMQHSIGGPPAICALASSCRQYFVVEHNGDVYPCDFFVEPELRLGNVATHRFGEMWMSETFRSFGRRKREVPTECRSCRFFSYCKGDCPKHRTSLVSLPSLSKGLTAGENPRPVSSLCEGWLMFFEHALSDLEIMGHERVPGL